MKGTKVILVFLLSLAVLWVNADTKGVMAQKRYGRQEHESFYNLILYSNGKFEYNYTLFRYGRSFQEKGSWKKKGDTLFLRDKVNRLVKSSRVKNSDYVEVSVKDKGGDPIRDILVSINGKEKYIKPDKKGIIRFKRKDIEYNNLSKRRTYLIQYYRKQGYYPIEKLTFQNGSEIVDYPIHDILANKFEVVISEGLSNYKPRKRILQLRSATKSLNFMDYSPIKKRKSAKFFLSE